MSSIRIPFVSLYNEETKSLVDSVLLEIKKAVEDSQFILSKKVSEFETRFAESVGTKYAVAVNSGLDALILSLRALGIGPGDEVISAPNSFLASASSVALVGAKPVFVDVCEDFNLDPDKLSAAMTPRTKAVIPVHLTGNPCRMDSISQICREKGVAILEDAAQAVGATYLDRPVGSWGRVNAFSLHPLKNLHVWGDGGMITTDDVSLAENLRLQRNHGLKNRDEAEFFSYNSRLDSIQAIVGLAFLETLSEVNRKRRAHANIYYERLKNLPGIQLPLFDPKKASPVFHVFQLRVSRRDELQKYLSDHGVETKIHYPIPIHLQPAAKYLGYQAGDFPVCEKLSREILSIPVRENLEAEEVHQICKLIENFAS